MRIIDRYGLLVGELTLDEALTMRMNRAPSDVDLLRVSSPPPSAQAELSKAGFEVKPSWINWVAPVLGSEETFLLTLTANERRKIRQGTRLVTDAGLRWRHDHPLEERTFDAFLQLYDRQVAHMPNGVNLARQEETALREAPDRYTGIYLYQGENMVGGCLCLRRPDVSTFQLRYVATAAVENRGGITRALYMSMLRTCRELGLTRMSLGNDTSLYGHVAMPGLYEFKKRMGFTPVPSDMVEPGASVDEADLFLSLRSLSDPALLLAYDEAYGSWNGHAPLERPRSLRLAVLSAHESVDIAPYRAPFLSSIDRMVIGA